MHACKLPTPCVRRMNKIQMIEKIASASGTTKKRAEKALDCMLGEITECLAKGEPVKFSGFGTFDVVSRSARIGRNVISGEQVQIPSRIVPVFRPGRFLKAAVQEDKK